MLGDEILQLRKEKLMAEGLGWQHSRRGEHPSVVRGHLGGTSVSTPQVVKKGLGDG